MKSIKKLFLSIVLLFSNISFAQSQTDNLGKTAPAIPTTPIPIEVFASNRGVAFQMIISKHFSPTSRFGFFNVTNFVGDYKTTNQKNQYLSQSFITADIGKGISFNAGVSMNYVTGFRPSAGLQYVLPIASF